MNEAILVPSISGCDDASLSTEWEGIAEVIEQLSCEYVHHKHSGIEVSQRKLKAMNKVSKIQYSRKITHPVKFELFE